MFYFLYLKISSTLYASLSVCLLAFPYELRLYFFIKVFSLFTHKNLSAHCMHHLSICIFTHKISFSTHHLLPVCKYFCIDFVKYFYIQGLSIFTHKISFSTLYASLPACLRGEKLPPNLHTFLNGLSTRGIEISY